MLQYIPLKRKGLERLNDRLSDEKHRKEGAKRLGASGTK